MREERERLANKCKVELLRSATSTQLCQCRSSAAAAYIAVRALINSRTVLNAI